MNQTDLVGRTAIVTGAGSGLGRAEALALAAGGANVVVNDIGPAAEAVAQEIRDRGAQALALPGDVREWELGRALVQAALDTFGGLDIVVNNAGVTRDAMPFNLTEAQWDEVVNVHLRGHAALSLAAAAHWRNTSKATGKLVYGRVINTASEAFLLGGPGQSNYAATKAGIVALTLSTSRALARYGVTANVICPWARTEMTREVFGEAPDETELDPLSPDRVGTFVAFLASPPAREISGQVFVVYGEQVALLAPPTVEQTFTAKNGAFTVEELVDRIVPYVAGLSNGQTYAATGVADLASS